MTRRRRSSRTTRRSRSLLPRLLAGAGAVLTIAAVAVIVLLGQGTPVAGHDGCYDDLPQGQIVLFLDASEPRWTEAGSRALHSFVGAALEAAQPNTRFSIFSTEGARIGSHGPALSVCAPAASASAHIAAGLPETSDAYLARERQRFMAEVLGPELAGLFAFDAPEGRAQTHESPLLESIVDISRRPEVGPATRWIVVSDAVQNGSGLTFCAAPGHMPAYETFQRRRDYSLFEPAPLDGVAVDFLFLVREGWYGDGHFPHCRDEIEIQNFWRDHFEAHGASVRFTRIRESGA